MKTLAKKTTKMRPIELPYKYQDLTHLFWAKEQEWCALKGEHLPLRLLTIVDILLKSSEITERAKQNVTIITDMGDFCLQGDAKQIKTEVEDIESFQHRIKRFKTLFHGTTGEPWTKSSHNTWFPMYSHEDIYHIVICVATDSTILLLADLADIYG